jgi:hypothetical protein
MEMLRLAWSMPNQSEVKVRSPWQVQQVGHRLPPRQTGTPFSDAVLQCQ